MLERNARKIYREQHDFGNIEEMIKMYMPLIKKIADKLSIALPPSLDEDDMVGCGVIGLLEAIDRYESSRGVQFTTFATWRIKGAMIDEIRRTSPAPRSFFSQYRQVHYAEEKLRQELNREPSREEIAADIGWSVNMVEQVWANYNLMTVVSLEKLVMTAEGDENLRLEGLIKDPEPTPEELVTEKEQIEQLAAALDILPRRERLILSLFYHEELTKKEIADILKVSPARISQLHARAVNKLREYMADPDQPAGGVV
jgi:RNA polymerase sigma factor FliA